MRIVFVGAVESSKIALDALIRAKRTPVLVITLPPEAAGRHSDFVGLGEIGRAAGSAIHHTTDINSQATLEAVAAATPDLSLVIGWSQVCRQAFREIARAGTVGFHPAALPRLRAAASSHGLSSGVRNELARPFSGWTTASTRDRSCYRGNFPLPRTRQRAVFIQSTPKTWLRW